MSSNDVGSYEFKRSSCEMQMEECSGPLARSTSDGSADDVGSYECKRSSWMHMEERSATLARLTSDGSADLMELRALGS